MSFGKRSYSLHKEQPLLKLMILVTTDGYILTVTDPYLTDGKTQMP